jgi:hypothetical protein
MGFVTNCLWETLGNQLPVRNYDFRQEGKYLFLKIPNEEIKNF